jgi:16S rRNA (adenine1518-N6/adenine1519-N6)-dimethyltransferase
MQLLSKVNRICDVPPSSFSPPPKVFSSLVVFEPIKNDLRLEISLEKYIDKLLRISFNSRRKMLKNTLNSLLSKEEINELSETSKICFNLRPQDISIDQWIKLAENCIKIKE